MRKSILVSILFILGCSCIYASNIQLFEAGKKAFSVGLYTIALENLNSFLDDSDGDDKEDDALYLCGISAFYLKKYNVSMTYFMGLESDYSSSPYIIKSYYWIGLNSYSLKKYNDSIIWFGKSIESSSKYRDISLLYSALSYIQLDDFDSALEVFLKVIEDPETESKYKEESLYRLSTLYLERKKPNQAINYLNKIIFDYPDSKYYEDSLSLLGESYFLLKEWGNAKRTYLLISDSKLKTELMYKRLASINYNLGELEQCRGNLEDYIAEFGSDKEVYMMLSDVLTILGDTEKAIDAGETVLALKDLTPEELEDSYFRMGSLHYKTGDFDKAYDYFRKCSNKESIYFSSISGMKSGKSVIELIKEINKLYPADKYSLDLINRYINKLKKDGNRNMLESFLVYVLGIYPENISYNLTYGEFLLEDKELEKSLKYLSVGYIKGSEHYSNISYKIGWIYYNKNEFSRSITYFDNVSRKDKLYWKALYSKSIAYYKIGELNKGETGFLELLKSNTVYSQEVSYYLGMIEKEKYNYNKAIDYFLKSKDKDALYIDSMDNMAWCYYHLKEFSKALKIYKELSLTTNNTLYTFNAANCYFFMKEYNEALEMYKKVIGSDSSNKDSAYYKVVEILFFLNKDKDAYKWVEDFNKYSPDSELPKEVIFTYADNKLNNEDYNRAISVYNEIINIYPQTIYSEKARLKKAESYRLLKDYEKSSGIYIDLIVSSDNYGNRSVLDLSYMLSEASNPMLTESVLDELIRYDIEKHDIVPVYIEAIKQNISSSDSLKMVEELIEVSRKRDEIDTLLYLKSLHYFSIDDLQKAESNLKPVLARGEVSVEVKIDSILLQGLILDNKGMKQEAIDLYLNLYLNFSDNRDRASYALYKGLLLTQEIGNSELEEKISSILLNEYKDTVWGKRGLKSD